MSNKYNGWTNYETWNFNLWITNDEEDYNYALKLAEDCENRYDLSKKLEEWAIEMADDCSCVYGFISDMINSSIKEVNFYEVAQSIMAHQKFEEEQE
tara:strand:+ start:485 stop:775 length:291 start_codon:yes stop_codon:yes gene_type:complete